MTNLTGLETLVTNIAICFSHTAAHLRCLVGRAAGRELAGGGLGGRVAEAGPDYDQTPALVNLSCVVASVDTGTM